MYRIKKAELRYKKEQAKNSCPFCDSAAVEIIAQTENFYILKNIFPYNIWDRRKVKNHLLVVSKKHHESLHEIDRNLIGEYAAIISNYAGLGFDVFTRGKGSITKTVAHFHTHLIKTYGKKFNKVHFHADPYELNFK